MAVTRQHRPALGHATSALHSAIARASSRPKVVYRFDGLLILSLKVNR
jgi:hypothetical protein